MSCRLDDEVRRLKSDVDNLSRSLRDVDDRFRDVRKACDESASSQRRELDHLRKEVTEQRKRDTNDFRATLKAQARDIDDWKGQVKSYSGSAKQKKENHYDGAYSSKSRFSSSKSSSDTLKSEVQSLTEFVYSMNVTIQGMKNEYDSTEIIDRAKIVSKVEHIVFQTNLKFNEISTQIRVMKAKQHQQSLALDEIKNSMSAMQMTQKHDVERLQETMQDKSDYKSGGTYTKIKHLQDQVHQMQLDMSRLNAEWKCTQETCARSHKRSGADDRTRF